MSDRVAEETLRLARRASRLKLRVGTIAATSPLRVTLSGAAIDAEALQLYTPLSVGDIVAVLQDDAQILIIGKLT